ncbi:MAG: MarR family transcriptional regulator [Candidatus Babeliales bacterium]|nr:MarR family transcriptional regulator [Candidatus Babeliales bacterium]
MNVNDTISKIRSSSRELVRQLGLLENRFSSIGSVSQCHAIVELNLQGKLNLTVLTAALNLEKSTTSRLVAQLYEDGICDVECCKNDKRNKLISLTKKGQKLANQINSHASNEVEQALNIMTEEERNIVFKGLSIYAKALKDSKTQNDPQMEQTK